MRRQYFLLSLLLVFSFSLRLWQLDTNPIGFFADEASTGVDAHHLLKTGRDRHGDALPLFFKGFNFDNVSPYQVYLTVPFVGLFGLNERAVRLTPVFGSTVELFVFYLLMLEFMPAPFALVGTLLLSISPWHFHLSRINMGDYYSWTLLTLIAYLWLVKAWRKKRSTFFILSAVFFGLATYSYTPARLTTPLVFGLTVLLLLMKKYGKGACLMITTYALILIPFIHFHFSDPHSFQRIRETMGVDLKEKKTVNTVSNKFTSHFLTKYFLHYSDTFLFQKGDTDFPGQFIRRHSISGLGLLYPYQIWLIIGGLFWLVKEIRLKGKLELLFTLFLLLLFPMADSLTNDLTPFSTRSYLGVLPFHLLIAFGLFEIYQLIQKLPKQFVSLTRIATCLGVTSLIIYSFITLVVRFNDNPKTTSDFWGWQYGPRDIVSYFKTQQNNYDDLFMSSSFNAPNIFFSFYAPNTCRNCRVGNLESYNPKRRQLFALRPEEITIAPQSILVKEHLDYPDGRVAFEIFEVL